MQIKNGFPVQSCARRPEHKHWGPRVLRSFPDKKTRLSDDQSLHGVVANPEQNGLNSCGVGTGLIVD
jgi:hypothetical protein